MTDKLSVRVVVEPDAEDVRLAVTGHLDKTNRWALVPLVRRACALLTRGQVLVDLREADGDTQAAAAAVQEVVEHDTDGSGHHNVQVVLPDDTDREEKDTTMSANGDVSVLDERRRAYQLSYHPDEDFPGDLSALALADLQILHSRLCWQADREYLGDGPHPFTMDRLHDTITEMKRRERLVPRRRPPSR